MDFPSFHGSDSNHEPIEETFLSDELSMSIIFHLKGRRCQDGQGLPYPAFIQARVFEDVSQKPKCLPYDAIKVAKKGKGCILIKGMDTQSRYFRLRREDIAYFKFILESYDGMAVVRTKDPYEAIVELMVAPGWEKDLEEVLEGLRREITLESIS